MLLPPPPPTKGFCPPPLVKVPFCLKMSEFHAEIAGNEVLGSSKIQIFSGGGPLERVPKSVYFSTFLFSLKSLFVVDPFTEKSLKKAL